MEKQTEKQLNIPKIDVRRACIFATGGVLIVLIVLLCITAGMRSHIQGEYTDARNEIGEQLYTELYMMCQTFDQVTVPGAEVQDVIIPAMKERYISAQALNTALKNAFSDRYAVLSIDQITAISAAFEAYDTAFRTGQPTDNAQQSMLSCVESVRATLAARYPDGVLKAS